MIDVGKTARKIVISLIGIPLLIVGIILIPLPGPGLLICFVALFILSSGFDWAKTYQHKIKVKFQEIYSEAKARADKIEKLGDKRDKQ